MHRSIGRPIGRQLLPLTILLLLATAPSAVYANVIGAVNKVRSHGCPGRPGIGPALRESSRLDEVARQLSRGAELRFAQKRAGYHAVSSASVQTPPL